MIPIQAWMELFPMFPFLLVSGLHKKLRAQKHGGTLVCYLPHILGIVIRYNSV